MFNIFEELSWPQFNQLPDITRLPLNEQINHYNQYLFDLSVARQNWIDSQNKGPINGFLQQENLFYILQENGYKIIIT
jgi:hypothetical protein